MGASSRKSSHRAQIGEMALVDISAAEARAANVVKLERLCRLALDLARQEPGPATVSQLYARIESDLVALVSSRHRFPTDSDATAFLRARLREV